MFCGVFVSAFVNFIDGYYIKQKYFFIFCLRHYTRRHIVSLAGVCVEVGCC